MQRLLSLLAVVGMMLTGCGGIEWFPEKVASVVTAFSFTPATGVAVGSTQTSNIVTLAISGDPVAISVSGDASSQYSINAGTYTKAAGTVKNGDQVTVQHTASATIGQTVTTTLTVGGQTATFSSTTGGTVAVSAFTFPPSFNVLPSSLKTSEAVTFVISGGSAPISISGDASSVYSINGAAFTSLPGTVVNTDQVVVQHTTANGADETTVTSVLTVGDKSASYVSSTGNFARATVAASATVDQSATAQVSLRLVPGLYTIDITDFNSAFSLDGVDFTQDTLTVDLVDGQTLFVTGFADPPVGTVVSYVFTLDGEPAITFNVTTIP